MRRSIVGSVAVVALLAAGAGLLCTRVARSMQLGEAGPPGEPRRPQARLGQALIADGATQAPKPAKPVPARRPAPIRLGKEPHPRVCQKLTEPTSFEFVEAPLQDVVDFLKDLHIVEIQIDSRALEDASVSLCTPVTSNLKGMSLGTSLDVVLRQLKLTYIVDGEIVLIVPEDDPDRHLMVRLYDRAAVKADQMDELVGVVQMFDPVDTLPGSEGSRGTPAASASGFKVRPLDSRLAIRATRVEHEMIRRLLADLSTPAEPDTPPAAAAEKAPKPADKKSSAAAKSRESKP